MPVVVTDSADPIGEALVRRVAATGAEVRAFAGRPALSGSLRAAGAKVTERPLDDPDAIRSALNDAHTLVHTVDGLFDDESDMRALITGTTERLVAAARKAGIRRFIMLSSTGADAGAANDYLRSKGEAEEAVRASEMEYAILRVAFPQGWERRAFPGWLLWTLVPGDGTQLYAKAPTSLVAAVLAAADDRATDVAGTYAIGGPQSLAAREVARGLRPGRPILAVRAGSRLARRTGLSPTALEVLASERLADAPDASAVFGA